ncbi:PREDICTED: spindle and kinetochore-associated protein 1-like [Ceratosolen solmsi marchali]|uniref:SKA complex subunit 1 n=1 Tax=Ceratosolen solmsi marchali TaxID=326594 RepID=A0AAJ6YVW7_9HYME|nr:PREDICTED: spindle and kinetochore-associated protein 1-like [Ceratosolen solmsi marchali]
MAAYHISSSLENLLLVQSQKLQDLEKTTELLRSKNIIHDDLIHAYKEVSFITNGIQLLKEDIKTMKDNNERCKELSTILKSLDHQIQHMENNIPSKIQEYINSELPENISNKYSTEEYVNNTINNMTVCNSDNINNHVISDVKSCKKILFNEPEIPQIQIVTEEEFIKIPKYIIGRYPLEILNNLVYNINQIIKTKYSFINLGKNAARKKGELDLYLHYTKDQTSLGIDEENLYFFTSDDYEKYIKLKIDKTKLNLLIALRHCKRLREIRSAKTVYYALII